MDTNCTGDIAEQAVALKAMEFGWGVSRPIGNRLPYDLIFDVEGELLRIQIKSAWFDEASENYIVDNRRTKTNRREMVRDVYTASDFDFAIIYLPDIKVFYVMPIEVFIQYGSSIAFVESEKRQRKPRSSEFREAWQVLKTGRIGGTSSSI